MKIHKIDKEVLAKTGSKNMPNFGHSIHQGKAYYVGKHPHLLNSMGAALYDIDMAHWLYKPEAVHTEWYRVSRESLVFEAESTNTT